MKPVNYKQLIMNYLTFLLHEHKLLSYLKYIVTNVLIQNSTILLSFVYLRTHDTGFDKTVPNKRPFCPTLNRGICRIILISCFHGQGRVIYLCRVPEFIHPPIVPLHSTATKHTSHTSHTWRIYPVFYFKPFKNTRRRYTIRFSYIKNHYQYWIVKFNLI